MLLQLINMEEGGGIIAFPNFTYYKYFGGGLYLVNEVTGWMLDE
jgi:hypothetical protein